MKNRKFTKPLIIGILLGVVGMAAAEETVVEKVQDKVDEVKTDA